MKLKEILNESPTELVARFHKSANKDLDSYFNPEADVYAENSRDYYKQFFEQDTTPVFDNSCNLEEDPDVEDWTNKPYESEPQSPGYRGQQTALERADVPHDKNVQGYDPHYFDTSDETGDLG